MKIKVAHFLFILLYSFWAHSSFAALPDVDAQGKPFPSLAPMLKNVNPAVVNISTYSTQRYSYDPLLNEPFFRRFFNVPDQQQYRQGPARKRQQSAGSGVIVDASSGIIITNYHVIRYADEVLVSLADGRRFKALLVGSDPEVDIAILKIRPDNLKQVKLADYTELEVGDFVVAIGNPFGLGQTVTTGVVSALGRSDLGIEGYENFIQTDASINPGNSGGALVNLKGELVGINTAIMASSGGNVGIGFAIPIDMAKISMDQIIQYGEVKRGQIGIAIQDITADLKRSLNLNNNQSGVLVTNVFENSPAERVGLKSGDIVLEIDGKEIRSSNQLRNQIAMKSIGDKVNLKVLRHGSQKVVNVLVASPPQFFTRPDTNLHYRPDDRDPWANRRGSYRHFSELQKRIDEMMNSMAPGNSIFSNQGFGLSPSSPKITMDESADKYTFFVAVPEGQEVELNTELTGNIFKITGRVRNRLENSSEGMMSRSMSSSQFSQSITLSELIDESGMVIDHKDKEIIITIPKIK